MEVPLQITLRDMRRSEALDARIRSDAAKLERLYPDIMSCRVVVEEDDRHRSQGRQFGVTVEVRLPGLESPLISNLCHNEDAHVALRDAFEATRKQLDRAQGEREGRRKAG